MGYEPFDPDKPAEYWIKKTERLARMQFIIYGTFVIFVIVLLISSVIKGIS